jgi:hypothetical protein
MPTEECKRLLDRDRAVADAAPLIDLIVPALREAVDYSLWALLRCAAAGEHDGRIHNTVPLLLFRHVIEMSDGLEVLFQQSCVVPAVPVLRSSFEAGLNLEYILNTDSERRALAWLCCYAHQQREYHERLNPSTLAGQEYDDVRQREHAGEAKRHANLPKVVENLNELLAMPYMAEVETRYQERIAQNKSSRQSGKQPAKKRLRPPHWYSLFDDPNSLRSLAARLRRESEYYLLYPKWSRLSHGNDIDAFIGSSSSGSRSFKTLRYASELNILGALAANFLLRALVTTTNHFRPGEFSRDKWIGEMQERVRRFTHLDGEIIKYER